MNLRDLPSKRQDVTDNPKPRRLKFQAKTAVRKQMRGSSRLSNENPQGYYKSDSGYSCVQHKYRAEIQDTSVIRRKNKSRSLQFENRLTIDLNRLTSSSWATTLRRLPFFLF